MVVIIGRANVGKSTLFNRLVKRRMAIIDEKPGVTRDALYGEVIWDNKVFELVDTGGLDFSSRDTISEKVKERVIYFTKAADLILFLVNAEEGLNPLDKEIAQMVRESGKPYILIATKIDTRKGKENLMDFYSLGLGEYIPISAPHSTNLSKLKDKIVEMAKPPFVFKKEAGIRLAIVGTPNTGKSTLVNAILNEERLIVHEEPGTTRDTIEIPFSWKEQNFILLDTAGIRRRSHVKESLEWVGVKKAEWGIEHSHLTCLVIDISRPLVREDLSLARKVEKLAKGVIVVLNKTDLLSEEEREEAREAVKHELQFLDFAPFILVSAKTGKNITKILDKCVEIHSRLRERIPQKQLNQLVKTLLIRRPPLHATTVYKVIPRDKEPHLFRLITNNTYGIKQTFLRYLSKEIRKYFTLEGVNIKITVEKKR